ncbi:DUF6119 family protein [Carnobacterium inhibens]|uniref:DUF6119 family protein n=1 Tax=Carnobacterium inhibens TaxID=147709 RepID=UPI00203B0FEF|nr:DUF6119 family protein [Carnobacterium inhibens]MCM3512257.1 TIGR04141 family sporadically distributed protein [Carnobacterium inhibens]
MEKNDLKIKANIYKIKEEYSFANIFSLLKKKKMEYQTTKSYDSSTFRLFTKNEPRNESDWINSLNKMFSVNLTQTSGEFLRGIVLITTIKNNYVAVYGYSKSYVDDFIEPSFGLDFASRAIKNYQIDAKNVDYLQKNTLRSSINYKKDRFELPQANEAFFGIVGTPLNSFFGKKINCKEGVNFTKSFNINNGDFFELFYIIDQTMELDPEISIPRLERINNKNILAHYLNKKLLYQIQNIYYSNIDMSFNIPYLHNLDENITDLNSNIVYRISYRVESTGEYLSEDIDELETSAVQKFIQNNLKITSLEDIKVIMYDGIQKSDSKIRETRLIKLILSEFDINNKLYLLQNGYWGTLNSSFLTIMNDQLKTIEEYTDNDGKKLIEHANSATSSYSMYHADYYSDKNKDKKSYAGENGYIESILRTNTPRVIKLHKRLIHGKGLKNEIADFYDSDLKEIFAVKMGTSAGDCVYSFEQSIVSMYLLKNRKLFNLTSELNKYNELTKYSAHQILGSNIVNDIQNVNKSNVLWVVPLSKNKKINKKIIEENFTLNDIQSFMVKLKLIEWFNTCLQNGFSPKLIMVSSNETLSDLPLVPTDNLFKPSEWGKRYYTQSNS